MQLSYVPIWPTSCVAGLFVAQRRDQACCNHRPSPPTLVPPSASSSCLVCTATTRPRSPLLRFSRSTLPRLRRAAPPTSVDIGSFSPANMFSVALRKQTLLVNLSQSPNKQPCTSWHPPHLGHSAHPNICLPPPAPQLLPSPGTWPVLPTPSNPDASSQDMALMVLQYLVPLTVLVITYSLIATVVWGQRTPGEAQNVRDQRVARSKRKETRQFYIEAKASLKRQQLVKGSTVQPSDIIPNLWVK
ncbi:Neuropeptide Y receptor [Gryllus bimaculatus]|nr:Neuropeptide Y receptor [Gryllus bimaculatus]